MIQIIPAIDLIDGKCVRLKQGDYAQQKVYDDDPLAVAKKFEAAGLTRLHVVDLDGAKAGRPVNLPVLKRVTGETGLTVDYGGGIKTDRDIEQVFEWGAGLVSIGSVAVKERERFLGWLKEYGADRIILSADARGGMIAIDGWQVTSELAVTDFIKGYCEEGIRQVLCTAIERDGMLNGPALELYSKILKEIPGITLIASGGVSSPADITALQELGVPQVVVGKALYEGRIIVEDLVNP